MLKSRGEKFIDMESDCGKVHFCSGPALECRYRRLQYNKMEKDVLALTKENVTLRQLLKTIVDRSCVIFHHLLDCENKAAQWDGTPLTAGWDSFGASYMLNYSSQSTQQVSSQKAKALTPAEEALKDLESIGRLLSKGAVKSESRAVQSSGSETAYESDSATVSKKRRGKVLAVVDLSSDEEPSVQSMRDKSGKKSASSTRRVATGFMTGKNLKKKADHSNSQAFAKCKKNVPRKKPLNLSQTAGYDTEENLMPLDLSQRVTVPPNVVSQQTSFSQPVIAGNKKRVPCPKCGKHYLPKGLGTHLAVQHSFPCKNTGCKMSFTSSKDLNTHQAGSMCKYLSKQQTSML